MKSRAPGLSWKADPALKTKRSIAVNMQNRTVEQALDEQTRKALLKLMQSLKASS